MQLIAQDLVAADRFQFSSTLQGNGELPVQFILDLLVLTGENQELVFTINLELLTALRDLTTTEFAFPLLLEARMYVPRVGTPVEAFILKIAMTLGPPPCP